MKKFRKVQRSRKKSHPKFQHSIRYFEILFYHEIDEIKCPFHMVIVNGIDTSMNQFLITDLYVQSKTGIIYKSLEIDISYIERYILEYLIIENAGLIRSMSKKGCSPDNSACEGFFGHLKTEMFCRRRIWCLRFEKKKRHFCTENNLVNIYVVSLTVGFRHYVFLMER